MARILLADDNAALLSSVGQALRGDGHLVTSTNSGADALALLASKPPPDLLILDLCMPSLDGHEVLCSLGPTAPPVLVITGAEMTPGDLAGGHVKRVLTKPFDYTALAQAVADALGACPAPAKES